MDNVDKNLLLKELDIYSSLLKKYEAIQREKIRKAVITQPARNNQQSNVRKSFQDFRFTRNQYHLSTFNDKFSFRNLSHSSNAHVKNGSRLCTYKQNFKSKYSLSKNQVSQVNNSVAKIKKVSTDISITNAKPASNFKSDSLKMPPTSSSSNESRKQTYNTKDFINEVESLTKVLKKETSSMSHKILNSKLNIKSVKDDNKNIFEHADVVMKVNPFSKNKMLIESQQKTPFVANHVNRINYFTSSDIKSNPSQQKTFSLNKSMYKRNNVKQSLIVNSVMSSKNINSTSTSKHGFENIGSKSVPETVVFSDSRNLSLNLPATSKTVELHKKSLSPSFQERIIKLHTPRRIVLSSKKNLKKSPHIKKIKSPNFLKLKSSNTGKVPRIINLNQDNTKFTKINKHLTPPKKIEHPNYSTQHKSSLKKVKKKINSKYKIINKTLTPSSSKKINTIDTSVSKESSTALSMDCGTFLDDLDDSAIEKLEKNLLALTSELASPDVSEKKENFSSSVNKPVLSQVNSESANKRIHVKKFKSRISKYKIINYNASKKTFVRKVQSPHMTTSLKKEKAVLVRRLFKSKNVIVNKNASPTSYSAKLIKSKYHLLNKRKSSNYQKYVYPTLYQYPVFIGSHLSTTFHYKQKQLKNNTVSRLIRRSNYRCQPYALTNKSSHRCLKTKINNRLVIRKFQRTTSKLVVKTPENTIKVSPASTDFASRVLHRSINRILTASSKKKLLKINRYCMFYNRFGRCNKGVKCSYIHDPSKIAVCTRFLRGTCKIDRCPFSHEVDPGKMAICSFFLVGHCDKGNCPYRHEKLSPHAVLCKDFVQGYCHYGKECKKAHILVCPKYVQGNCDKGSSCTFPHPPQKAKKNVQEEIKNDETKSTDVFLDNVLRYFQQIGDLKNKLDENNSANLFVPKQRKLEQQPSFIPLSDDSVLHSC